MARSVAFTSSQYDSMRAASAHAELAALALGAPLAPLAAHAHLGGGQRRAHRRHVAAVEQRAAGSRGRPTDGAAREVRVLRQAPAVHERDAGRLLEARAPGRSPAAPTTTSRPRSDGSSRRLHARLEEQGQRCGATLAHDTSCVRTTSPHANGSKRSPKTRCPPVTSARHEAEAERVRVVERQHGELRRWPRRKAAAMRLRVGQQVPLGRAPRPWAARSSPTCRG